MCNDYTMPMYEYECSTCSRTMEQFQRMSDPQLEQLEGCTFGLPCELRKLFSVCSLRTKGIAKEYDPPTAKSPMSGPSITRDWMEKDGTTRPMKQDEINRSYVGKDA